MSDILFIKISVIILFVHFLKTIIIGSNFSIYNYFKYKDDYIKWYTIRQQYIPPHKRKDFKTKR